MSLTGAWESVAYAAPATRDSRGSSVGSSHKRERAPIKRNLSLFHQNPDRNHPELPEAVQASSQNLYALVKAGAAA